MKGVTVVNERDGFGAQYHHRANALAYCTSTEKCCYQHTPFTYVAHGEDGKDLQNFTGMSSTCDRPENVERGGMGGNWEAHENPTRHYTDEAITKLREMYHSTPKPEPIACSHAVHVRRGDVTKAGWPGRWVDDEFYTSLISDIKREDPSSTVCVFSEGDVKDFAAFEAAGAEMHLNDDLKTTFHSMVHTPNLVVAKSSLSWIAGVLSEGHVTSVGGHLGKLDHWSERLP